MKILYNDYNSVTDFKHFKEWFHIIGDSVNMKKKGYFGSTNFILINTLRLFVFVIISIMWFNIYKIDDRLDILSLIIISISNFYIIFFCFALLGYFIHYNKFKKNKSNNKKKNSLVIDDNGITDTTDDMILSSKWNKLTHIFVGEYYITILTTTNIIYFFPIDIKDRLISGINKYNTNKELKIIEKNVL